MSPDVMCLVPKKLLSREVNLFLKIRPRNLDNGDTQKVIPDHFITEPQVEVRLLRLGVGVTPRIEPEFVEGELDGRNSFRLIDDETEKTIGQGRGEKLVCRSSPVELKPPFQGQAL